MLTISPWSSFSGFSHDVLLHRSRHLLANHFRHEVEGKASIRGSSGTDRLGAVNVAETLTGQSRCTCPIGKTWPLSPLFRARAHRL